MRCTVYLWKELTSEAADVVETVRAWCGDTAIQKVMKAHRLPYVYYAWAVPENDTKPCVDRVAVRCYEVPLMSG